MTWGSTWTENTSVPETDWRFVASSTSGDYLYAMEYPYPLVVHKSTDKGVTWSQSHSFGISTSGGSDCLICSANGQHVYAAGINVSIQRSTDYGATWTATGDVKTWSGLACSADGSIVYASTYNQQQLFKSTDYGVSWTELTSQPVDSYKFVACSADGATVYLGGYRAVHKSTNGGGSFSQIVSESQFNGGEVLSCCAVSSSGAVVYIATAGGLWVSNNGGTSFALASFVVGSGYVYSVSCTSDGTKAIATFDYGSKPLYVTEDSGSTWTGVGTPRTDWSVVKTSPDGSTLVSGVFWGYLSYASEVVTVGPTITSISPSSGSTSGGTVITITGTGFHQLGGEECIFFGNTVVADYHMGTFVDENTYIVTSPTVVNTGQATVTMALSTGTATYDFFTYVEAAASQLFMDGFDAEYQGALTQKWASSIGSNSILPSSGRRGTGCLSLSGELYGPVLASTQEMTIGFAVQPQSGQTLKVTFWDGNTVLIYFMMDSTGHCSVMNPAGDSVISSHPSQFSAGLWAYVELYSNNSTGDWSITKNGTNLASGIHSLTGAGYDSFGLEGVALIDDLYQLNGTSLVPLGNCRVDTLPLNANSTPQDWVPDTGNAWERLNIDDGGISSIQIGEFSLFTVSDLTHAPTTVFGVQVTGYGSSPEFTPTGPTVNAALLTGSAQGPSSTLFDVPVVLRDAYIKNPDTTADWTDADVNSLEVGVVVTA